jgi:hypothetical protein
MKETAYLSELLFQTKYIGNGPFLPHAEISADELDPALFGTPELDFLGEVK